MTRFASFVALGLAGALLAACASAPPPPAPPDPSGPALRDWRGIVTSIDRDRYRRLDSAWALALQQARRQAGSGDLDSLGDLIDPDAKPNRPDAV